MRGGADEMRKRRSDRLLGIWGAEMGGEVRGGIPKQALTAPFQLVAFLPFFFRAWPPEGDASSGL